MSCFRRALTGAAALLILPVLGTGPALAEFPDRPITFLAQAAPGSGFDTLTRAVATTLQEEKLVTVPMPVTNTPSSAVGMQTAIKRHANDAYMLSFQSVSGMTRYAMGTSEYTHKDVTPIARLISDYYLVAVRADSEFKTLQQLLDALRANPRAFPIAGGQSDDRIFYGQLFSKAGIDPTQINYVAFSGGGEASALLLEGSAKAMVSTVSDVSGLLASGQARALAFSGANRLKGELKDIPTLKEAGVDFEWQNFRYAMGGPGMPAETRAFWQKTLAEMVKTPTWQKMLERYRWGDEFMVDGLDAYLDETQDQILKVARQLGMASK